MFEINWNSVWSMIVPFLWWSLIPLGGVLLFMGTYALAQRDLIVGFVPQGQIKAVMSGGSLRKMLVNVGGYVYNERTREIEEAPAGYRPPWRPFGLYLIGIPLFHRVLTYPFSWLKWDKKPDEDKFALISRAREIVNSLFFRYPYGVKVEKIKVQGNIDVNIILVVTIEVVKPETTLFRLQPTGNWLGIVIAKVDEAVRGYAGEKNVDIEKLRSLGAHGAHEEGEGGTSKDGEDDLRTRVMSMNGWKKDASTGEMKESPEGIRRLCGVEIISVEFQNWEFADPAVGEAFRAKEVETKKAEGIVATAKGKAEETELLGRAEGRAIAAKFSATGSNPDLAARLAEAEALAKTPVRVLSIGGQPPINTVPVAGPGSVTEEL